MAEAAVGRAAVLLLALLAAVGVGGAPLVGSQAPAWQQDGVLNGELADREAVAAWARGKYVVLLFYPLDFTFVCPTEILAFSERHAEFEEAGATVVGVSVDSKFSHLAWVQAARADGGLGGSLAFPLVSDLKREISEAYGVLNDDGVALRGLFIVDKEGVVQHATINNLGFGRSVDEALRTLHALQHVQTHDGEVCPAGWKRGAKTMRPDQQGLKDYFRK